MALIQMHLRSKVLGMQVPVTIMMPHRNAEQTAQNQLHRVLWLLHSAGGDHSDWLRFSSIERYAEGLHKDLCVVMPSARMSCYRDMVHGGRYFTHIADELPQLLRQMLPLSPACEHNYVCGVSMGGYGALRMALLRPQQYAVAGCMSAGLSNYQPHRMDEQGVREMFLRALGDVHPKDEMAEMEAIVREVAKSGEPLPKIYHCCGTEDFLLDNARTTRDVFQSLKGNPFGYTYEEGQGAHTWAYWDEHIQHFLTLI